MDEYTTMRHEYSNGVNGCCAVCCAAKDNEIHAATVAAPTPPRPRVDVPGGRELDAKIAEACGWRHVPKTQYSSPYGNWIGRLGQQSGLPPSYSTDLNVAATLGAEAVRLGLADKYLCQLWETCTYDYALEDHLDNSEAILQYGLLHATAEQRAAAWYRAYLATVETGAKEKKDAND